MTSRHHIRPGLVNSTMNQETRRISRQTPISPDRIPIVIHQDHIAGFQQAEMFAQRVRPEGVRVLRVAHGDVARHAFGVALAGEDAEGKGHFGEHPLPVGGVGGEGGDAGEGGVALGD